jgi:Conserved region of unknown function on GLTSCR protein
MNGVVFLILFVHYSRFASRLASDHSAVLSPNLDTPFSDVGDVVTRLLPYHVFQQPKEDLELLTTTRKGKGKGKATAEDLKIEISGEFTRQWLSCRSNHTTETRFALECFKRRAALHNRLRRVKIRSGKVIIIHLFLDESSNILSTAVCT